MHTNRSARMAAAAFLVTVLVGCGSDPSPEQWAADVCRALSPWRTEITSLNARAQRDVAAASSPVAAKTSLLALLSGAEGASQTAFEAVTEAGVPDVDGGDDVARRFAASLSAARDAYARARRDLEALPVDDADAFYAGVTAVLGRLTADYALSGPNTDQLDSPELRAAFDGSEQCR